MLRYLAGQFCYVVICYVTIPSQNIAPVFSFNDMSVYPIGDVSVFCRKDCRKPQ